MIYCPSCGTGNRDGSRFCNECGAKLPTMTSSLCPSCGTPNPPHSLFCEKCGARLIAALAEEPAEPETSAPSAFVPKGLSLPIKSPSEFESAAEGQSPAESSEPVEPERPAEEELPDWMQVVQSAVAGTSELDIATVMAAGTADQSAPEEVPDWLSGLGLADQPAEPQKAQTDELLPEWARRLRATSDDVQPSASEEEVPEWLKALGATGQLPTVEATPSAEPEEALPWAANLGAAAEPPAAEEEELPEWLQETPSPYLAAAPDETPPPAQPAAEELPDWLRDLRPAASTEDTLPDWLDELGMEEQPASESMALSTGDSALDWLSQLSATAPELPSEQGAEAATEVPAWLSAESHPTEPATASDWMSSLRAAAPEVDAQPAEETPDWLSELQAEQRPLETAEAGETPDWMKGIGLVTAGAAALGTHEEEPPQEPAAPQKPVTDWLSALRQATPETEAGQAAEKEAPEWLPESSAALEPGEAQPPEPPEEEGVPDWLKGAGLAAATVAALEEEQPQEPVASQKPATDWLSALRQATPEMEAGQAAEEETPEWLREESSIAPEAIGGPQAYEQEIPDWLREAGAAEQPPTPSAEEEIPEWLRETQAQVEVQPSTPPEEEGVPDWLKGLGVAAAGAAAAGAFADEQQPEEVAPQKPATDWLTALRRATPEIEAEQASEEAEPEWLREESGAAPGAIGGLQAYDEEAPDWLREETGAAAETAPPASIEAEEEEGIPDWLKGLGGAAAVAATTRKEEPPEEELPEWLREGEPAPAIAFEAPAAEQAAPGESPDWLRELAPAAAVAAAEAEEPEEAPPPEEAAEAEPEEESWAAKAAPAAAGLAAAAVVGAARRSDQDEAAPAEMPEWLREIRQEQQAAKAAIPVPAEQPEITQAEIPAWLEALRPTEEAAAPQEPQTPSETEGPLAGIANALPPVPYMGEIHGLPAKMQFAISAEDQARAGVLKELLTQHAVAPASVEQFVVKGSVIRRRALRWIVAFLIIFALFIPVGLDLNQLTGLALLPTATRLTVPSPVQAAAFEIARLAQLPPDSKVLMVFDYDAAQSGELNRVASALLQSPALRNAQVEVASLNPQGLALAQMVLKTLPNVRYTELGFAPGQVSGVQSLLARAGDVKLIIEVAASPETVRWWTEQLQANRSEVPLVVGVSAGAEPLTMPYLQSGQVQGLVSGFAGAVAYLNATGMMNTYSQDQIKNYQIPLDALALANYVMAALIVVGLIAALLRGAGRRSA
jgi:hypothetical protein